MTCVIEGKYCRLDYSDFSSCERRAKQLIDYFDIKYPRILELVGLRFRELVNIRMDKTACGAAKVGDNDIVFNASKIHVEDKGFLIHEGTHVAQNFRQCSEWLMEAMAEFVRLKLGWDYPKRCYDFRPSMVCRSSGLHKQHYWVWADFYEWLTERYANKGDLLVDFTAALKKDPPDNEERFLTEAFGKSSCQLWMEYVGLRLG